MQKKLIPFSPLQVKNKPHDKMQICAFILELGAVANTNVS
jgi:hypothetical protein